MLSKTDLIARWPGLAQRISTGGDAPDQPRGLLILHAHAMVEQAIRRRDELLAEAQGLGVPVRALAPLVGVSFNTVARWIKATRGGIR